MKKILFGIILSSSLLVPQFFHGEIVEKQVFATSDNTSSENVTSYTTSENKTHNIYWAKGITPPKMTNDPEEMKLPGYFSAVIDNKGTKNESLTYVADYEPNHGYYDFNKNIPTRDWESPHCYLGSAGNMLRWWLEQNKEYVTTYLTRLKNGEIYSQVDGLKQILPFNKTLWDNMYAPEVFEVTANNKNSMYGLLDFFKVQMNAYYTKSHGYSMDHVLDFFFSGYKAFERDDDNMPPINSIENYKKDKRGGYFFPIFENNLLTERFEGPNVANYAWVEKNLRQFFKDGKAVSFAYHVNENFSHAITVWGAEYDENDHLVRLYIVDTDDAYQENPSKNGYGIGIHSFGCHKIDDKIQLSNIVDPTREGSKIQQWQTLSLAQDIFEKRLNDISAPEAVDAKINDVTLPKGADKTINVDFTQNDTGSLRYQWYKDGAKIEGATTNSLRIDTSNIGIYEIYCEILNMKNGKETISKSNTATINVTDEELINAETPKYYFDAAGIKRSQYKVPVKLDATAHVNDGGTLTYQWYSNYAASNVGGTPIKGATGPTYLVETINLGRIFYYCTITNTNYSPSINGKHVVSVTTLYKYVTIEENANIQPGDLENAKAYATLFLNSNVCGTNDNTKADSSIFLDLQEKYNALSFGAKVIVSNRIGDPNSDDVLRKAIAKYDRIIFLHGKDEAHYPDFMDRLYKDSFSYLNKSNDMMDVTNDGSDLTIMLAGVLFTSLIVTLGFVIYRKRKSLED